jgi:predicted DNA-binding transcriptional regulator AlpA
VAVEPADIEAIAARVVELIDLRSRTTARFIDATELAHLLGVRRNWVYEHASQLGAIRLSGTRGRLRFDAEAVTRALQPVPAPEAEGRRERPTVRRRRASPGVDLLPF